MDEKTNIQNKLKEVISKTLKLEQFKEIPSENLFVSLGIDSLMALELLVCIEQEFDIQISDEDLSVDLLSSLDNLTEYITAKNITLRRKSE